MRMERRGDILYIIYYIFYRRGEILYRRYYIGDGRRR
jgi:hypothetical protein